MNKNKIEIKTTDGTADCHFFHPPGKDPCPGVIIYMDAFGIRPTLLGMAERLSSAGYDVLLPNLFYRAGPQSPIDPKAVFAGGPTSPERERLQAMIKSLNPAAVTRDTSAYLDYLAGHSAPGSKVGCVGYCMGGGYALTAAGQFPNRVGAAASFHGGRLATDQPDSPHLLAPKIRASVYIGVAGIDSHFPDAEKERLKSALESANVRHQIEVYPNVHHAFTMSDVPVYNHEAAERHWERLLQFLSDAKLDQRETSKR